MSAFNEPVDSTAEQPSASHANPANGTADSTTTPAPDPVSATDTHAPPAPEAQTDVHTLLAQAQEEISQYHEHLLRAKAETENIRRRAQEDVSKARKFGIESFAESLVPVKDSLEAALAQPDQSPRAWQEGVEVTLRQLSAAFERNALKEIAPAVGEKFDPHLHQAISSAPSEQPEGSVTQLLQKGYTIADRVLRPALVMVSSGTAQAS